MRMKKIVLASLSPRRKELLKRIVPEFSCEHSNFDESSVKVTGTEKEWQREYLIVRLPQS